MEPAAWPEGRSIAIPMLREASAAELGLIRADRGRFEAPAPNRAALPFPRPGHRSKGRE